MDKTATPKGFLWDANFVMGGFISLLLWNTVINVSEYLSNAITKEGFTQMTFTYCFGNVLGFCTAGYFFTSFSRKATINIALALAFVFFFLCIFCCDVFADPKVNQYTVSGLTFVTGFFIALAQSKITGMAGEAGHHEIVDYNFGTGLAGVATNILAYIFSWCFPTSDPTTQKRMMLMQVYANCIVVIVSLAGFWVLQHLFHKTYTNQLDGVGPDIESVLTGESSEIDKQDSSEETPTFTLIRTILDTLLGVVILYITTLMVVAYFNIACYFKFDEKKNGFTIPVYTFFYNLFDTLGKFIPPAYLLHNSAMLQSLNSLRLIQPAYFFYILFFSAPAFMNSPYLRVVSNIILGLGNGYLTSSFFTLNASRFTNTSDKGRSTYFSVLFLCIGVVLGTFINLLLEHHNRA